MSVFNIKQLQTDDEFVSCGKIDISEEDVCSLNSRIREQALKNNAEQISTVDEIELAGKKIK